jgi:hypothetical protein
MMVLGISTGEFSPKIREIDVLTTIFTIPVKFIDYQSKGFYKQGQPEKEWVRDEEIERLLNICMNALK